MNSKAQRIRALYAAGKTIAEIAAEIGCRTTYVRTCARQRVPGGYDAERARRKRLRVSPLADRERAREAHRIAYAEKRAQGASTKKAKIAAVAAYSKVLEATAIQRAAELAKQHV